MNTINEEYTNACLTCSVPDECDDTHELCRLRYEFGLSSGKTKRSALKPQPHLTQHRYGHKIEDFTKYDWGY